MWVCDRIYLHEGCHRDRWDKRPLAVAGRGACLHLVLSDRWPVTLVFDLFNANLSPKDVLAASEIPGRGRGGGGGGWGGGRHSKQQLLATTRVYRKCRLEVDFDFVRGGAELTSHCHHARVSTRRWATRSGLFALSLCGGSSHRLLCHRKQRHSDWPATSTASETLACHSSSSKDASLPQHCRQKHSLAGQNATGKYTGLPRQCKQRRWSDTTLLPKTLACQNATGKDIGLPQQCRQWRWSDTALLVKIIVCHDSAGKDTGLTQYCCQRRWPARTLQAKTLAFHNSAGNDAGLTQHCW